MANLRRKSSGSRRAWIVFLNKALSLCSLALAPWRVEAMMAGLASPCGGRGQVNEGLAPMMDQKCRPVLGGGR